MWRGRHADVLVGGDEITVLGVENASIAGILTDSQPRDGRAGGWSDARSNLRQAAARWDVVRYPPVGAGSGRRLSRSHRHRGGLGRSDGSGGRIRHAAALQVSQTRQQ